MPLDPIILDELATNRGIIDRPRKTPTGAEIPYVARNPSGDWTDYLPEGERQWSREDSMSCVTFAMLNCIEAQEKFLTGKTVNYSDRWIAMISGTMRNGNWLQSVADAIAEFGLVREETWPTPSSYTWSEYMARPNATEMTVLKAEGAEWKKTHDFRFGFIETSQDEMMKYIQQCPLSIVFPNHSVANFFNRQEIVNFLDSYEPYRKQTQRSKLTDAARPVLTMKTMKLVNDNGTIWLVGDKGKMGFADMESLNFLQALSSEPIENGSTAGIPSVKVMQKGFTIT